jgi:hypothetical protein
VTQLIWQSFDRDVMVWPEGGIHIKAITAKYGDPVELSEVEAQELGQAFIEASKASTESL